MLSYASGDGGGSAIELSGVALGVSLRRNVLVGRTGVDAGGDEDKLGVFGAALRIEDNVVAGLDRGIDLGGRSAYLYSCRVGRNEVLAGASGGIVATGAVTPGASLDVVGNKIATTGAGITVGPDATVDSNAVNTLALGATTVAGGVTAAAVAARTGSSSTRATSRPSPGTSGSPATASTTAPAPGSCSAPRFRPAWSRRTSSPTPVRGSRSRPTARPSASRSTTTRCSTSQATRAGADGAIGIGLMRARSVSVVGNTVARVGLTLPTGLHPRRHPRPRLAATSA